MATTKVTRNMLNTGIVDNSNATAITIDSSENVGIGTASPRGVLDLGSGSGDGTLDNTSANYQLILEAAQSTTGDIGRNIAFVNGSQDVSAAINSVDGGAGLTQDLMFAVAASGTLSEVMRLDATGNVGIGTSSPSQKLEVYNSATDSQSYVKIQNNRARNAAVNFVTTAANWYVGAGIGTDTDVFQIYDGDVGERMRIDSSGNVGIGTTSPSQKLHVVGKLKLTDDLIIGGTSPRIDYDGGSTGSLRFFSTSTGTERMRIESGGNVGIGTTSPAAPLSVHGNVQFRTTNTDGNEERINWNVGGASDAPSQTMYGADGATAHVVLHAGGSSYFTGGNLGVGDNSPAYRLELPNTGSSAGQGRANAWVTYSDSRIKSNIQTLSYGLDIVKQLKPSQYKHHNSIKEDGQFVKQDEGVNDIGFIAQEVLPLIPEVVSVPVDTDKDLYSISYQKLTAVLTKAIQEQQTIIEDLKTRIETLEG